MIKAIITHKDKSYRIAVRASGQYVIQSDTTRDGRITVSDDVIETLRRVLNDDYGKQVQ